MEEEAAPGLQLSAFHLPCAWLRGPALRGSRVEEIGDLDWDLLVPQSLEALTSPPSMTKISHPVMGRL